MKFFIAAFFLFSICCANSQPVKEIISLDRLAIGWQAGINRSNIKSYYSKYVYEPVLGYRIGLFSRYNVVSEIFSVRGEINFEKSGAYDNGFDYSISLKYLNFGLYPNISYKFIYTYAGVSFGYLLDKKLSYDIYPGGAIEREKIKKSDLGFRMGFGIRLLRTFEMDFSYYSGITSIYNAKQFNAGGNFVGYIWHRNRNYAITLRVPIRLHKTY